jgi:L-iditol 2-dehydrogenase
MRAHRVAFTAPGKVAIEPFELPEPADDELLVETLYTTISPGTERSHYLAEVNTVTRDKGFPFYPGYSNIGRVMRGPRAGEIVATSLPHVSHGIVGRNATKKLGIPPGACFAADSGEVTPVPIGLDAQKLKECSTYCFSRVGLHGVRRARIELGESVAVLGLGPIGLQCVQYAKLFGGFPVVGIDPSPTRRRIAAELGADATHAKCEDMEEPPNVVIEATGLPDVIPQAFKLSARHGRIMLLGSTRGVTEGVNFYTDVHKKGLTIVGVHASTRPKHENTPGHWTNRDEIGLILRLIAAGRVRCGPLITHEFPAAKVAEAYETVRKSPDAIAVVLNWKH